MLEKSSIEFTQPGYDASKHESTKPLRDVLIEFSANLDSCNHSIELIEKFYQRMTGELELRESESEKKEPHNSCFLSEFKQKLRLLHQLETRLEILAKNLEGLV